ncbi:MAG TPA: hypothetical protein VF058_06105 [Actinomycetota bacterium]
MHEIGLMYRWGKLVPGRERAGIEHFASAIEFFGKKLAEGVITFFEPYFSRTTDLEAEAGFIVIKGPREKVLELMEDEEYLVLLTKTSYLVEHFTVEMLTVGEEIQVQLERAQKVFAELGI